MTTIDTIDTTVQKTQTLLKALPQHIDYVADEQEAYEVIRAVLTTLRDRLTPELAHSFGAQLTPLLRGIYYEGWSPGSTPVKMDRATFLRAVHDRIAYPYRGPVDELVVSVLTTVGSTINPQGLEKLKTTLPEEIADLLP